MALPRFWTSSAPLGAAIVLVLCTLSKQAEVSQFPQNTTVRLGENATFRCITINMTSIWKIWNVSEDGNPLLIDTERFILHEVTSLKESGIFITGEWKGIEYISDLTIAGTLRNSFAQLQCTFTVGVVENLDFSLHPPAFLKVIGPPSTPADLAATENGVGSLNISWSLVGVEVNFTVTVMNLNDSSTGPMEVSGIQDQHYIFTLEDSTSCDVYSFQVTAVNGAGTGNTSEIITRSLPSLPDISPVQDSLQHSLARTASGVTLSVTFNGAISCPEYSAVNYTFVLLEDSTGLEETSDGALMVAEKLLEENSRYFFNVKAANKVGAVKSAPILIVTTDVQGVVFTRVEKDTYSIQCIYLSGSDVSGCAYVLVSGEEGVENVTGFIERDSHVTLELGDGCYSEVLAYDWEKDNSTGIVPQRAQVTNDRLCIAGLHEHTPCAHTHKHTGPPTGALTAPSSDLPIVVIISVSLLAVSIILAVLLGVITLVLMNWNSSRKMHQDSS